MLLFTESLYHVTALYKLIVLLFTNSFYCSLRNHCYTVLLFTTSFPIGSLADAVKIDLCVVILLSVNVFLYISSTILDKICNTKLYLVILLGNNMGMCQNTHGSNWTANGYEKYPLTIVK